MTEKKILIAGYSSLTKTIEDMGYSVCANVKTARQAVKRAKQFKPDLILINMELSGDTDGISAAQMLNKETVIPIVFILSATDKKSFQRIMKTRHYGCLTFPFSNNMLEYTIITAMERYYQETLLIKQALNKSELEWRSFIEYAPVLILKLDIDCKIIFVNRTLSGKSTHEIIGTSIYNFVSKTDVKRVKTCINHVLKTGESGSYDIYLDKGLHPGWYKVKIEPLKSGNKIINLLMVVTDITEHREAEAALKESEERYRSLQDNIPIGIFRNTVDGRPLSVNPYIINMLGYSSEYEIFNLSVSDLHIDTGRREKMLRILDSKGSVSNYKARVRRKDGSEIWCSFNIRAVRDKDGNMTFLDGTVEEITERKKAELALLNSEVKARALLNSSSDAIILIDLKGTILDLNEAAVKRIGKNIRDAIGSPIFDIFPEENALRGMKIVKDINKKGAPVQSEIRFKEAIYHDTIYPVFNYKGEIAELAIFSRDITSIKKAEIALKESEERYRRLVENMNEGILVTDSSDRITYVNNRCSEIFSIPVGDFIGKNFIDIMELRSSGVLKKNIELRRDYKESLYELIVDRPFGTKVINISPHSIFDDNKKYQGSFSVLMDITERKKIEEELRKSEEIYRTIFENTGTLMVIADSAGNLILVNDEFSKFAGFMKDELENMMSIFNFFDNDEEKGNIELYLKNRDLTKDLFPETYETWLVNKYGHKIDVLVNIHLIPGTDLRVFSINDITFRKKLEREVLEISMEEQQRIGRDLHDGIGQDLTGIAFMTKVLAKKLEAKGYDESAEASVIVDLINESIEQSRAFSRGLCPVKLNSGNLVSTLKEYALHCEKVFNISCRVKYNHDFKIIDDTTALHIYFIVKESVNNAVKHGNSKNIVITLTSKNGIINTVIADDGIGIPDNYESKEGIGLKIMSYRADLLNGFFEVVRNNDGGTSVRICFKERYLKMQEGLVYGRA